MHSKYRAICQNHLILEKRKPLGTKQYELFNSCHQKTGMKFVFPIPNIGEEEQENTQRKVQPLALKARYRWYLIAKDLKDNRIKPSD
jgi:predicted DNA-binding transcriptional regulator YafY